MANFRFYLDIRREKPGIPSSIKIVIAHANKTAFLSSDVRIFPDQWDDMKCRVINHPEKHLINAYLSRIRNQIDNILLQLAANGLLRKMQASDIRNFIKMQLDPEAAEDETSINTTNKESSFLYRFKMYRDRSNPGTQRTFNHTLNRLIAFIGEDALNELTFEEINNDWLKRFDNFMAKTAPAKNSRNVHFRNMRTVFNDAIEDNVTTHYPFRRFKIKNEVTAKRDLTVEELRTLFYFKAEESYGRYRDYFMLMFFLMGINNIDLCNLKEIVKGRVEFHRAKTRHFFSMKIEPEAMVLINKYRGNKHLIDILDRWDSPEYFLKKMNKLLKKFGPITRSGLGGKITYHPLFPRISSYYSRHSWTSIALSLDIPIETISEGLGHQYGNPITVIYLHYDNRKVDAANRKVIDWLLYGKIDGVEVVKPGTPEFFGMSRREAMALNLCSIDDDSGPQPIARCKR